MSKPPLVSVVLPTYNRARRLEEAMHSVLNQSYANLELIVVDDGSNDDTPQVVAAFGDPRVHYTAHALNRGAAAARNTGIRSARGEYVAFQDSDDVWRQDKLSVQIGELKRAGVPVCVCSYRLIGTPGKSKVIQRDGRRSGEDVIRYLLRGSSISTQTIVAKTTAVMDAGGFDESLEVSEDYELCLRLAERHDFVFVSRPLVDIRRSVDSISGDARRFAAATEHIVAKHAKVFANNRRGYSRRMFKTGKYFAYSDSPKDSLHYVSRALKANPLNGKAIVLLLSLLTRTSPILRKIRP